MRLRVEIPSLNLLVSDFIFLFFLFFPPLILEAPEAPNLFPQLLALLQGELNQPALSSFFSSKEAMRPFPFLGRLKICVLSSVLHCVCY